MRVSLPRAWPYKRFHISYVLSWAAVGLLAGTVLGQFVRLQAVIPLVVVFLVVCAVSLYSRRWYACVAVVAAGCVLGLARGDAFFRSVVQVDQFAGQTVTISGTIGQDPVLANGSNVWRVQLSDTQVNEVLSPAEIYATVVIDAEIKRGDKLKISGKAQEGFGNFRLSLYRVRVIDIQRPPDVFLAARDHFAEGVRKVVPEPEASLGLGFLVGQKSALPEDLSEQMKVVGLTHIVVASGYNLTILVRFARRMLARRSRYLALAGSLALVVGFAFVSGFSPSMNRAAVVTVLTLVAWYYGRQFHPLQLILLVAAGSALFYPPYVWGDLGWLLSFAAFAGILIVAPILTKLFYPCKKEPGVLTRLVLETLSAEIMTLPIIILAFGYVPTFALLANTLVAPVIPFAMFFTFVAGLVGLAMPALMVLALPASILIAFVVVVVGWLSSLPAASIELVLPGFVAVFWYGALTGLMYLVWRRRRVDLLGASVVE